MQGAVLRRSASADAATMQRYAQAAEAGSASEHVQPQPGLQRASFPRPSSGNRSAGLSC